MAFPILSSAPRASAPSNSLIETEEWDVTFVEAHNPRLPSAPASGDGGRYTYSGRLIQSKTEPERQKWLYVFLVNLTEAGQVDRSQLHAEGYYDAGGALKLINWATDGAALAGQDVRPATVDRPGGRLTLAFRVDGSAARGASGITPASGGRSVYLAFLSHVQLPAARIQKYVGEWARENLPKRAILLDPSALTPSGEQGGAAVGYGPTASDAAREAGVGWIQVTPGAAGQKSLATVYLVDYVDLVGDLHARYEAALTRLNAYDILVAEKTLHAAVTEAVVRAYAAGEDEAPEEAPGRPLDKILAFRAERQPYMAEVDAAAALLYRTVRSDAHQTAREDATDFGEMETLTEAQLRAIEAEVERQGELLDGAGQSEEGRQYLRDAFAETSRLSGWYRQTVFSSTLIQRLGKISVRAFKADVKKAWTERKTAAATAGDFEASRVRTQALYLSALEQTRLQHNVSAGAKQAIEALQAEVLEELARAPGSPLALPGSPAYEATVRQILIDARRNGPVDLDAVFREGPRRAGFRPLPASQIVGVPGEGAGFSLLDPEVWIRPGQGGAPPRPPVRFQGAETFPSGIVVVRSGRRIALVRAGRPVPPQAPPVSSAQRKMVAIAALQEQVLTPDDTQTMGDRNRLALGERNAARQKLAQGQASLRGAEAELDLRVTRLTTAGRLVFVLGVFGAVESSRAFARELNEGRDRSAGGEDILSAYLGAFGAGASTAAGVASSVDALEAVSRRAALAIVERGKLGIGLKVFGVAAGIFTMAASGVAFYEERQAHDDLGQVSAGLAFAGGLAGAYVGYAYIASLTYWWLPYLGYLGAALAVLSLLAVLFSNTPLEDWLESCLWSSEENSERLTGASLTRKVDADLQAVIKIISVPLVSLEFWDGAGRSVDVATYGSVSRPVPDRVRLVVRTGYLPPGGVLDISDLHLRLPPSMSEIGDYIPFMEGSERERVTIGSTVTISDPTATVYVAPTATAPGAYVREWALDGANLPARAQMFLRMPPAGVGFGCTATIRPAVQAGSAVPSITIHMRGNVGYARTADGIKLSVAAPTGD